MDGDWGLLANELNASLLDPRTWIIIRTNTQRKNRIPAPLALIEVNCESLFLAGFLIEFNWIKVNLTYTVGGWTDNWVGGNANDTRRCLGPNGTTDCETLSGGTSWSVETLVGHLKTTTTTTTSKRAVTNGENDSHTFAQVKSISRGNWEFYSMESSLTIWSGWRAAEGEMGTIGNR